ncbi:MAG: hypothetical protein HFF18_06305 [Oscillospiraceae bacterium]|nr:hypothetical protein [Oscillospiraceae bacterium]
MSEIKCTVNAKDFQQALSKALKAAPRRCSLPFLTEACISFDHGVCTLTGTNLELWCQASIPAQGGPCSFVLTGSRKLLTACKYFSGELEFFYQEDPEDAFRRKTSGGWLTLRCGNRELRQRVAAAQDFPALPDVKEEHAYEVNTAALSERFDRIKYAISEGASSSCSCCVKFFDNRIGAVDGHRLAVSQDESLRVEAPFFIPPVALKLLPVFDGETCRLSVGERYAVFDGGSARVITRIPQGDCLNFDAAIPRQFSEECIVDTADFVNSLRYLNEFIPDPERMAVRFGGGVLSVSTGSGEYRSALTLSEIPETVCGFKGRYMLEGLKQFQAKKRSTITMGLSSPGLPIVLTDGDGDLALICPYRLKKPA